MQQWEQQDTVSCEVRVKVLYVISSVWEADSSVSNYSLYIDQTSKDLLTPGLDKSRLKKPEPMRFCLQYAVGRLEGKGVVTPVKLNLTQR